MSRYKMKTKQVEISWAKRGGNGKNLLGHQSVK